MNRLLFSSKFYQTLPFLSKTWVTNIFYLYWEYAWWKSNDKGSHHFLLAHSLSSSSRIFT